MDFPGEGSPLGERLEWVRDKHLRMSARELHRELVRLAELVDDVESFAQPTIGRYEDSGRKEDARDVPLTYIHALWRLSGVNRLWMVGGVGRPDDPEATGEAKDVLALVRQLVTGRIRADRRNGVVVLRPVSPEELGGLSAHEMEGAAGVSDAVEARKAALRRKAQGQEEPPTGEPE